MQSLVPPRLPNREYYLLPPLSPSLGPYPNKKKPAKRPGCFPPWPRRFVPCPRSGVGKLTALSPLSQYVHRGNDPIYLPCIVIATLSPPTRPTRFSHFRNRILSFRHLLTPPAQQTGNPQTLGPALRSVLPSLFPSSRDPVLAHVVLHGAPVPFSAPLEELMREAAYPDGWLCLIVVLL